jgi:pimeloyl-ACP methyl ester carboxylesterase
MKIKFVKWIGYLALFGLLCSSLVFYFLVPKLMVEIRSPSVEVEKKNRQIRYVEIGSQLKGRPIEYYSNDSLLLTAYLSESQTDSVKGTIILVHGIRGRKEYFIGLSQLLAERGYNAVLMDLRAHGQSEGRYCTFGVKEKWDIKELVDELKELEQETNSKVGTIGIWGQSLGGAVALQAMSIDSRIKFGVIESTVSNLESIAHDYLEYFMYYSFEYMSEFMVYRAGLLADFDPKLASPIKACTQINQPVFMVHGDHDKKIDIKYGKANFNALKSKKKKFVTVPGASHVSVWQDGGEDYFNMVFHFIDTIIKFRTLN